MHIVYLTPFNAKQMLTLIGVSKTALLAQLLISLIWSSLIEPIGGSQPKTSSNVDPSASVAELSQHSLTCPVQGSPKPSYRWSHSCINLPSNLNKTKCCLLSLDPLSTQLTSPNPKFLLIMRSCILYQTLHLLWHFPWCLTLTHCQLWSQQSSDRSCWNAF